MKAKLIKKIARADNSQAARSKSKKKKRGSRRGGPAVDPREAFNSLFPKKL